MYQFFLGLDRYLPAFSSDSAELFASQATSLAILEQRERLLEREKRELLNGAMSRR